MKVDVELEPFKYPPTTAHVCRRACGSDLRSTYVGVRIWTYVRMQLPAFRVRGDEREPLGKRANLQARGLPGVA